MKLDVGNASVWVGDCRTVLKTLPNNHVDSVVTDPPYELGFTNAKWDASGVAYSLDVWRECLRVLKPGAHLAAFGGTRTWHRLAVAIEDAGFELRDSIAWLYGSGFPKSVNLGNEFEAWQGWGTALKPAFEPIVIARKPLDGKLTENVNKWGVGGLNIDASRVSAAFGDVKPVLGTKRSGGMMGASSKRDKPTEPHPKGRWPANVIFDDSQFMAAKEQFGEVSRFFYCAKPSAADKHEGVDKNTHPTVKPTSLMRYLINLLTPRNGLVLDPFCGSGSTGKAALTDGYAFIGVELTEEYLPIIEGRLRFALEKRDHAETLF